MQTITLIRKPAEGKAVHGEISFPISKKTLNAYLWKVCGEAYDAQH